MLACGRVRPWTIDGQDMMRAMVQLLLDIRGLSNTAERDKLLASYQAASRALRLPHYLGAAIQPVSGKVVFPGEEGG